MEQVEKLKMPVAPTADIRMVIDQHGALNVLALAALSLVRGPRLRPTTFADDLPSWIRKDVGLPEEPRAPPLHRLF